MSDPTATQEALLTLIARRKELEIARKKVIAVCDGTVNVARDVYENKRNEAEAVRNAALLPFDEEIEKIDAQFDGKVAIV